MKISMSCKGEYEWECEYEYDYDLGAGAVIRLCTPGTLMLPLYKVKKNMVGKKTLFFLFAT